MRQPKPVVVFRSPVQPEAEMVLELLHGEGIDARLIRPSGTLAGAALNLYESRIEVAPESAERAAALLVDFEVLGASEEMDRAADGATETESPSLPRRRRALVAAGVGLLCPGGSHLYARHAWTSLVLALGVVAALGARAVGAGAAGPWLAKFSFIGILAIVLADIAGGVRALGAFNRGQLASRGRQVVRGLVLLGSALVVAASLATLADAPRRARARLLAHFHVSCSSGAVQVENDSEETRTLVLESSEIVPFPAPRLSDPVRAPLNLTRVALPPHGRDAARFHVNDVMRAACADATVAGTQTGASSRLARLFNAGGFDGGPIRACVLWLRVSLQSSDRGEAESARGAVACVPPWGTDAWTEWRPVLETSR